LGEEPFFELGVFKVNAAVVVDFIYFAFGSPDAVIVTVVPLPPALASGGAFAEAVIGPGLQNFRNYVFPVVQLERHGGFNLPISGDLYLATEKTFRHSINMLAVAGRYVNIIFAGKIKFLVS